MFSRVKTLFCIIFNVFIWGCHLGRVCNTLHASIEHPLCARISCLPCCPRDPSILRDTSLELALANLDKVTKAKSLVPTFTLLPRFLDSPEDGSLCRERGSRNKTCKL
jgi:hypothetical protein